jgi:poly(3-hydroxyalkanoate) synthetase
MGYPYFVEKITLVGYSMGGLILRAALPYLEDFKDKLDAFVTLATPHIGYLTTHSKLLTAGMWIASKLNLNSSVAEITISDKSNLRECALYILSELEGLEWFNSGKPTIMISLCPQ